MSQNARAVLRRSLVVSLFAGGAAGGGADAAELKVLSAGAMKTIVADLAEPFRQETGHTVRIESGTAGQLRDKALAGEIADVVIPTDTVLEQLADKGGTRSWRPRASTTRNDD